MPARWLRVLVGTSAGAATVVVGVVAAGVFKARTEPDAIPPGANLLMLILAIALVVAAVAYAIVEWLQTRRFDSVARQFDTRTIVLIPIAIAINVALGQTVANALKLPVYFDSMGTILVGVLAGPIAGAATGLLSNVAWTFLLAGTPFGSPYAWPFAIVAVEIGFVAGLFGYAGVFRSRPNASPSRLLAGIAVALAVLGVIAVYVVLPFYRSLCPPTAGTNAGTNVCFELFAPAETVDPILTALAWAALAVLALGFVGVVIAVLRRRDLGVVYTFVAGAACGVVSALVAAPIAAVVFGGVTGSGTDLLVAAFQQAGSDLQQAVLQQSLTSDPIDKAISYVVVFLLLGGLSRRVTARFPQGERALGTIEA